MNKHQKLLLQELIVDCETYRLTESEAKEYVSRRTNGETELSHNRYYRMKRYIHSDPEIQSWFDHHTRIGFVIEHRKRISEMELVQKELLRLFEHETAKNEQDQDKTIILKLSAQIESTNKRLSELNLGNPVIAEIKKQVDIKYGENAAGVSGSTEDNLRRTDPNRIF